VRVTIVWGSCLWPPCRQSKHFCTAASDWWALGSAMHSTRPSRCEISGGHATRSEGTLAVHAARTCRALPPWGRRPPRLAPIQSLQPFPFGQKVDKPRRGPGWRISEGLIRGSAATRASPTSATSASVAMPLVTAHDGGHAIAADGQRPSLSFFFPPYLADGCATGEAGDVTYQEMGRCHQEQGSCRTSQGTLLGHVKW